MGARFCSHIFPEWEFLEPNLAFLEKNFARYVFRQFFNSPEFRAGGNCSPAVMRPNFVHFLAFIIKQWFNCICFSYMLNTGHAQWSLKISFARKCLLNRCLFISCSLHIGLLISVHICTWLLGLDEFNVAEYCACAYQLEQAWLCRMWV